MLAGRLASNSVPPRLTASLKICSAFRESERGGPAADNVEGKCGAGTRALLCEQTAGGGSLVVVSKVTDLRHLGVVTQVVRHEPRVRISFFHAEAQCFERPADHPAGMGIQLGADGASQRFDAFHEDL